MLISLRSRLAVGAVAMAGAGTLVLAPAIQTGATLPVLQSRSVELSALASPITEFMGSMDLVVNDLVNGYDTYEPYEMWQGIVPEFIYNSLPVISTLGYNGSYYVDTLLSDLVTGPTSTFVSLGNGILFLPGALIDAAAQAVTGDIAGALTTLVSAIVDPITQAATSALDAVSTVVGGIVTNLVNVLVTAPSLLKGLVDTTIGATQTLIGVAAEIGTNFINALTSLNFEAAWNTAVEGLLGPTGFPGAVEAVTLGPGLGTWGTDDYISSYRVWAQTTTYSIANALGGTFPPPSAAASVIALPQSAAASEVSIPAPDAAEDSGNGLGAETSLAPNDSSTAASDTASNRAGPKLSTRAKSVTADGNSGPARSAGASAGHAKARAGLRAAS